MPAPPALRVLEHDPSALGRYLGFVSDLDTTPWDASRGLLSPRRTQRKTWIFVGAFSPRFMVGFAVVDAGLLSTAFAYVFDRERGQLLEEKLNVPLGFASDFAATLDTPWLLKRGAREFRITPRKDGFVAEFRARRSSPFELRIDASRTGPGMSTLAASSPGRPFHFTYKECELEQHLSLRIGSEQHELHSRGMLDFTLGYPPRRTFWNWAAGNGQAGNRRIGFNLVAVFNQGLENALWIDGQIVPLGQASFRYDAGELTRAWHVTTDDGVLEATFEPEGKRAENLQALVISSKFAQLFGRFSGSLLLEGERVAFTAYGVVEEHHAVW